MKKGYKSPISNHENIFFQLCAANSHNIYSTLQANQDGHVTALSLRKWAILNNNFELPVWEEFYNLIFAYFFGTVANLVKKTLLSESY